MISLPRFSVDNPILVNLFMMTVLVSGAYSALTLVREMFPESQPNRILVTTSYPGASPAEVEKGITLKIEEKVKDIEGVEKTRSTITEGRSVILIEMQSGFDAIDRAVNDVKAAIDSIPSDDFPEDALKTQVTKFEPRFPVMNVSLFGDLDDRTLKKFVDRLRDDILELPGITNVTRSGSRKDEISVEIRPEKLVEYGLSFMDVADAIASSNLDLPGGQVKGTSSNVAVRTLGEKDRGEDLNQLVVRSDSTGQFVLLSDVATIVDGFEDQEVEGRFNGQPSVGVTVFKTPEQDAIQIAALVRAMVAGKMGAPLDRTWVDRLKMRVTGADLIERAYQLAAADPYPPSVKLATHTDLSRFIEGRLDLLMRNGAWGLLLVFLSLLVFLHWRVAFWVMMGLVLAVAGTLVSMQLLGLSLNLISMLGLIIVLGLLVDDAIVVAENVYSKVERGIKPDVAAVSGTEEVTAPVVCAILTTIVAFIPLMFIEGQIGDWMGVLPVVICVALSASLVEALTILPAHLAHGLRPIRLVSNSAETNKVGWTRKLIGAIRGAEGEYLMPRLRRHYERLLRVATTHRYVTMSALIATFFVSLGAVIGGHVPFVFLQKVEAETFIANIRMDVGASASATRKALRVLEQAALKQEELSSLYSLVGIQISEDGMLPTVQPHLGQAFIELKPEDQRERGSEEILQDIRALTSDIPGVRHIKFTSLDGGPGGAAIHIEVRGQRSEDLVAVSAELEKRLSTFEGVFDIVNDFEAGRPEVQIELYDSARSLGLTTQSLATQVRSAFYGFEARKIQRGREDVRIMVRYPPEHRRRIYDIESMWVASPSGALVPFSEVARLTEGTGYASIKRTDQQRTVTVTADVDETLTNSDKIMATLASMFPDIMREYPGVQLAFGGQKLETTKSFASLKQSFVIALMAIFVILSGLFRSYIQPMIVMAVIPFGLIGAVAGHFVMGYPLTILSMIGIVALTGIVVNDSMILVLFVNRSIASGTAVNEAVIKAGLGRLRPILLTSATTVLGIAPLMLETSFQAKFLIPIGISISAGLIFATLLTLIAVPSLFLIIEDVKSGFTMSIAWLFGRASTVG